MNTTRQTMRGLLAAALLGALAMNSAMVAKASPSELTARTSPAWLRSSVVYEIFPRDFSRAGDLNTITARLDQLKDLGVNILWLMPIHPIGQKMRKGTLGSPFAVRDYYAINPAYGTTNDFKRLIREAHKRGMKIVMDIPAGQTSWDSVLMKHPDFYLHGTNGAIIPPEPAWTDVAGLNYANPEVRRYMIDMMKYWLKDYHVDGFRCDVAPNVPLDFWVEARTALEKVNPQVIMLADAGNDPALLTKAFDVDSSWGMIGILNQVMSSALPATFVEAQWENEHERFPRGALHLRFTDNHEEVRAVARYGIRGALAAEVLMLTLDGVPLIYNGMEVGDATPSADPALFEKLPIFWHVSGRPPLRSIYRDLIKLRRQNPAFYNENVTWLTNTVSRQVVSYLRKDSKNEFLVLINLASSRINGSVELPHANDFVPVKINSRATPVSARLPDFHLEGYGWYVYRRSLSK